MLCARKMIIPIAHLHERYLRCNSQKKPCMQSQHHFINSRGSVIRGRVLDSIVRVGALQIGTGHRRCRRLTTACPDYLDNVVTQAYDTKQSLTPHSRDTLKQVRSRRNSHGSSRDNGTALLAVLERPATPDQMLTNKLLFCNQTQRHQPGTIQPHCV